MRRSMRTGCFAVAAVLVWGAEGAAGAQSRRRSDEAQALELFHRSEEEYRSGRFREAADLLRAAHSLHAEPTLLYNLGRALEGAGDVPGAVEAYEHYLSRDRSAPDRAAIEARIATLRGSGEAAAEPPPIQRGRRAESQREAPAVRRARSDGDRLRGPAAEPAEPGSGAVPWVVTGLGLGGLVVGVVFGVLAADQHAAAEDDPVHASALDKQSTAEAYATAANVSLIAGGIVGAVGLVWLLARSLGGGDSRDTDTSRPRFGVSPSGVAFEVSLP